MPLGAPYSKKFMASLLLFKIRVEPGCCLAYGGSDLQGAWLCTLDPASSSAHIVVNIYSPLGLGDLLAFNFPNSTGEVELVKHVREALRKCLSYSHPVKVWRQKESLSSDQYSWEQSNLQVCRTKIRENVMMCPYQHCFKHLPVTEPSKSMDPVSLHPACDIFPPLHQKPSWKILM